MVSAGSDDITFYDLEFATVPITRYSSRGFPWTDLVPVGMPSLPPTTLECVCYLYSSEESARVGEEFGGTGFLISDRSERLPKHIEYRYVVTNWHNVFGPSGASVIRINTHEGEPEIIDYGPEHWFFDPRFDIAVAPVKLDRSVHKFKVIPVDGFLTETRVKNKHIGPGDDVFMVGRFVDHDGGPVNNPAVRFGHISVMPTPIKQPNEVMADSFCIDMHSRTGYSGSPVFVYRTPGSDLTEQLGEGLDAKLLFAGANLLLLLGIHFAQFPEIWELVDGKVPPTKGSSQGSLITEGKYVKGLSGMTCVLPAWNIKEVLNLDGLCKLRARWDKHHLERFEKNGYPPEAEGSEPPTTDENPQHKEDFNRLLRVAVEGPKSSDKT